MNDLINNNPFASTARQLAQSALKANEIAFEGFETIAKLQLKNVESSVKSSLSFLSEATDVADVEAAKAIWPKSASFAKESTEQAYAASQEVLNQAVKTSEALAKLFREQFQAANDSFTKAANKAAKKA